MKSFVETIVLVLFVGSFAVGYATSAAWHEQLGLSMFAAALLASIINIAMPSRKTAPVKRSENAGGVGGRDRI